MKGLRTAIVTATGALAVAATAFALAGTASAAPPAASTATRVVSNAACGAVWGTNPKQGGPANPVTTKVNRIRAGQQPCFDRLVIDLGPGARPGYRVSYVKQVYADPSGKPLSLRGKAFLLITVRGPAGAHYNANATNLVNVAGFSALRQVRGAGSFEAVTSIGVGVRAKTPFRVFYLSGPGSGSRLVIDVAR